MSSSFLFQLLEIKSQERIQDFRRRDANPLGGAPTYKFIKMLQKLHEIEKMLGHGGGRGGGGGRSANESGSRNSPEEMQETENQIIFFAFFRGKISPDVIMFLLKKRNFSKNINYSECLVVGSGDKRS